jgi:hypothetical protein
MDAITELVRRSRTCLNLQAFHAMHQRHPELLDFLVEEIQLRIAAGFTAFSYVCLWEYARWKIDMEKGPGHTFLMNNNIRALYGRAITILHPEFNGLVEFRPSIADEIFGTAIESAPKKRPKNYSLRLQWADGTALENGWRPTVPHVVGHVSRKPDIHRKPVASVGVAANVEQQGSPRRNR